MLAQMFIVGSFQTNCYVVSCEETKEAIILDPGFDNRFEAEKVFGFVAQNSLTIRLVLNTHGHPDHTSGNGLVKEKFHVPIYIHEYDAYMLGESGRKIAKFFGFESSSPPADVLLRDGDFVKFGESQLKVLHTPGHSRGSISLLGIKRFLLVTRCFGVQLGGRIFQRVQKRRLLFP